MSSNVKVQGLLGEIISLLDMIGGSILEALIGEMALNKNNTNAKIARNIAGSIIMGFIIGIFVSSIKMFIHQEFGFFFYIPISVVVFLLFSISLLALRSIIENDI